MTADAYWGIFSVGFVFGYLLYFAVRHTERFNIEMLMMAIGAIGGATVIALLGNNEGWIGPYGKGMLSGFAGYFVLSVILLWTGAFQKLSDIGLMSARGPGARG